ncbi:hypothetical protein EVAR_93056_1 [Eumeta japonica]|uniref:Uncharacterized protein n=1 Tax=Eumeta variegata TaxID=151549 RepID=A0A4C1TG50_EUMVA|nr:hypothetical protein EVAR_93056_1 [Eumeta japonica]
MAIRLSYAIPFYRVLNSISRYGLLFKFYNNYSTKAIVLHIEAGCRVVQLDAVLRTALSPMIYRRRSDRHSAHYTRAASPRRRGAAQDKSPHSAESYRKSGIKLNRISVRGRDANSSRARPDVLIRSSEGTL